MEHQLLQAILAVLRSLDKPRAAARFAFTDSDIVRAFSWSALCDRPTSWACDRKNGPIHLRRRPLPSPATMSRRLRAPSVVALLGALERRVTAPEGAGPVPD